MRKQHLPTILSIVAGVGVISAVACAIEDTPKALLILEEKKKENEELTKIDKLIAVAPVYIPTAVLTIATITCIASANILNVKQQKALMGAYMMLDGSFKTYRKKTKELYGEDSDIKIRNEISKDKYPMEEPVTLFYDQFSKRYFESTPEDVLAAEYHFNRNFILRGYASVNEFYEFLGIEPLEDVCDVGWSIEAGWQYYGYQWIDFAHDLLIREEDGRKYYVIAMPFPPTADYMFDFIVDCEFHDEIESQKPQVL